MRKLNTVLAYLVLTVFLMAPAADAQAPRTWVSALGDDGNPCAFTLPCKTFQGAFPKTAAGGEINVLDVGGYGAITITKAITISGEGTFASILAVGGNGITINAGVNDRVVLRNLSISGNGTGTTGIRFLAGKSVLIDNVTISGFTSRGIDLSLAASADLFVKDTTITKAATGIFVTTTSGLAQAALDNVDLTGLATGFEGAANSRATISNSIISGNGSNGILGSAATAQINVEGCQVSFNGAGINASVSGAIIRLSNNEIYNNTTGVSIAAGAIVSSARDNRVAGNGSSSAPNGPPIPTQ